MNDLRKRCENIYKSWIGQEGQNTFDSKESLLNFMESFACEIQQPLIDALTSIASLDSHEHNTEAYWLAFSKENLAEVIAMDTQIARSILSIVAKESKNG